jgi:tellurite resistance protein TerC
VFAILGLRSLYFVLAGVIHKFHYLKLGLAAVLVWVGTKMLVTYFNIHIPVLLSLGVVAGVLAASVIASLLFPRKAEEHDPVTHDPLDPGATDGTSPIEPSSRIEETHAPR